MEEVIEELPYSPQNKLLFLLGINTDEDERYFVQKLLLRKDGVRELCNTYVPNSFVSDYEIDFSSLEDKKFVCVGVAGSAKAIVRYLLKQRVLEESLGEELLHDPTCKEKGIYAIVLAEIATLLLIYWHPDDIFEDVHPENTSCNLLRYMVELSDQLLLIFNEDEMKSFDLNYQRIFEKTQRNTRVKIVTQNTTENKVTVEPGFQINYFFLETQEPPQFVGTTRQIIVRPETVPASCTTEKRKLILTHPQLADYFRQTDWARNFSALQEFEIYQILSVCPFVYPEIKLELDQLDQAYQKKTKNDYVKAKIQEEKLEMANNAMWYFDKYWLHETYPHQERLAKEYAEKVVTCEACTELGTDAVHLVCGHCYHKKDLKITSKASKKRIYKCISCERFSTAVSHDICKKLLKTYSEIEQATLPEMFVREVYDKVSTQQGTEQDMKEEKNSQENQLKTIKETDKIGNDEKKEKEKYDEEKINIAKSNALQHLRKEVPRQLKEFSQNVDSLRKQYLLFQEQIDIVDCEKLDFKKSYKEVLSESTKSIFSLNSKKESKESLDTRLTSALGTTNETRGYERNNEKINHLLDKFILAYAELRKLIRTNIWYALIEEGKDLHKINKYKIKQYSKFQKKKAEVYSKTKFPESPVVDKFLSVKHKGSNFEIRVVRQVNIPEKRNFTFANMNVISNRRDVLPSIKLIEGSFKLNAENKLNYISLDHKTILFFINEPDGLYIRASSTTRVENPRCIKYIGKNIHIITHDEKTRFLALYSKEEEEIGIYRFDERLNNVVLIFSFVLNTWIKDIDILGIKFVPGKKTICLVNKEENKNRLYFYEIDRRQMRNIKPVYITFPMDDWKFTPEGNFLLIFSKEYAKQRILDTKEGKGKEIEDDITGQNELEEQQEEQNGAFSIVMRVMLLSSLLFIDTIPLDFDHCNDQLFNSLHIGKVGGQAHLMAYSDFYSSLISRRLDIQTEDKQVTVEAQTNEEEGKEENKRIYFNYFYYMYDKFCIKSELDTELQPLRLTVVSDMTDNELKSIDTLLNKYFTAMFDDLQLQTQKNVSVLKWSVETHSFSLQLGHFRSQETNLANWIQEFICLVPIQIARAESGSFIVLSDGMTGCRIDDLSVGVTDYVKYVHFGLYETIFASWKSKDIRVVSSMGKQSSGKSYMLNHLTGSLFDISGGRCTDGVWMTLRVFKNTLLVILDFEGIGSFERSDQEDMLLSLFNAAISTVTIYKTEARIDKDTAATFTRFQNGVGLISSQSSKLFTGLFLIAIRDVDPRDLEKLKEEFVEKLKDICLKSGTDNFLSKMYAAETEICSYPPLGTRDFYDHLRSISDAIFYQQSVWTQGREFLNHMVLLMGMLRLKAWSSIDSQLVSLIISNIKNNFSIALSFGCLTRGKTVSTSDWLCNILTDDIIEDEPILFDYEEDGEPLSLDIPDVGLFLVGEKDVNNGDFDVKSLMEYFVANVAPRSRSTFKEWHKQFQHFIELLVARRVSRIKKWIETNTNNCVTGEGDVDALKKDLFGQFQTLEQKLQLCGIHCSSCYYYCLMPKYHTGEHNCMGDHICEEHCFYCQDDDPLGCGQKAGHDGRDDCLKKDHTCGKQCHLHYLANCNETCVLKTGHPEELHICNARQHLCGLECSLPKCKGTCITPYEINHTRHKCQELVCPEICQMEGCNKRCSVSDNHFHALGNNTDDEDEAVEHYCGSSHPCQHDCEELGICEVKTELVKETRMFSGKYDEFSFDYASEQNGFKKKCCIQIEPGQTTHSGPHCCTTSENIAHYCDERCCDCGYFCRKPWGHTDKHTTNHGNMHNCKWLSNEEKIYYKTRKYARGESGVAEMCNLHCKKMGRGHTHLIQCGAENKAICEQQHTWTDGIRHHDPYEGDEEDQKIPKDEVTHQVYYEMRGWEDPCPEDDSLFHKCPALCPHEEHSEDASEPSYCKGRIFHPPLKHSDFPDYTLSQDGHAFDCIHYVGKPVHTIFVVDCSGSMAYTDLVPTIANIQLQNRLGCVFEACFLYIQARMDDPRDIASMVLFNTTARQIFSQEPMHNSLLDRMLAPGNKAGGGTSFCCGLKEAKEMVIPDRDNVIIFLSDGMDNTSDHSKAFVQDMMREYNQRSVKVTIYTILFGVSPRNTRKDVLEFIASAGNGTFYHSIDEITLCQQFNFISTKAGFHLYGENPQPTPSDGGMVKEPDDH
eukprot:CAMPEP_0174252206 /NCGR_PEP_ID=MMETSP0439-20130205/1777_1 /TAXON_ID=0 /ORGANISM="Stereomyxa ramosa, Strain Chinc5" /LENGTH=2184 /DNA_ID=CAMNT_0015332715 /DNA_START=325 /DNA_END=6879 /DNA_ORIENTATION=-